MTDLLFSPVQLGGLHLRNRIVMAPLTRGRAGPSRTANDVMAEYYGQRASAGLIISEATAISAQGYGWNNAPALYTDAHVQGWRKTTKTVHEKGGKIVLQLWHMGRVSHPDFLDGALPVAPSAIAATGHTTTPQGKKDYVTPRALDASELPGIVQDYKRGALLAKDAGFDGVEIHAANGYLLDQFIRDGANQRKDEYGGTAENRIRFVLEVVREVVKVFGPQKTGIRVSPHNPNGGMSDSDPVATFTALAKALDAFDLAYLHVMEPIGEKRGAKPGAVYVTPHIRKAYKGPMIVNGGYDAGSAEKTLEENGADAVAFGVKFIANPDLVERFKKGASLNEPRPQFFYLYDNPAEGYTDYPFLSGEAEAA